MQLRSSILGGVSLVSVALVLGGAAIAQTGSRGSSISDAQVEANVLRALAGSSQLATQAIKTTTVYGTVTLSGSVTDETSRTLAETLASKAPGVLKVVDELSLSSDAGESAVPDSQQGSNPQLQSDGTVASADDGQQQAQTSGQQMPATGQNQAPEPGYVSPPAPQDAQQQAYPQSQYPRQQGSQPQYTQPYPGTANGQSQAPPYRQPYPGSQGYPQQNYGREQVPPPYGAQEAGKPVTIPAGAMLRVRLNEGLNSKRVQPGVVFDAVVLNDVVADGEVAIPRGASVRGTVIESKNGGSVGGKGRLGLQLTSVTLGGQQFPVLSDNWTEEGRNTGGRTAGNVLGLGALGALIGAAAGGGPGAAIGAVAGGATGLGVSAAEGPGRVVVPAEAILTFHLAQPASVTTVSQAEMERLGYGVQQGQMYRRPPPAPGYYAPRPVYYPYPY